MPFLAMQARALLVAAALVMLLGSGPALVQATTNCYYGEFYNLTSTECQLCPPSTFKSSRYHRDNNCDNCPSDRYSSEYGQRYCWACPEGQVPTENRTACQVCPAGTYIGNGGSDCKACPRGKYQPYPGQSTCLSCEPGKYQYEEGQETCLDCPAGLYNSQTGRTSCKLCGNGRYSPATGAVGCLTCRPGKYQGGEQTPTECLTCQPGTFMHWYGYSYCRDCPANSFANFSGAYECPRVKAGEAAPEPGMTEPIRCPNGTYNYRVGYSCRNIPAGREAVGYDQEFNPYYEYDCRPGHYTNLSHPYHKCAPCPAGSYQSQHRKESCNECPEGKYTDRIRQTACRDFSDVPAGYELQSNGTASSDRVLVPCPPNTFRTGRDGTHSPCLPCPAETTSPGAAGYCTYAANAADCTPGEYYDGAQCQTCSSNHYTTDSNAHTCADQRDCLPGQYQVAAPTRSSDRLCALCGLGTYSEYNNRASCTEADISRDEFVDYEGAHEYMKERDCLPGSYIAQNATTSTARVCLTCPDGSFTTQSNRHECEPHQHCPPGTYIYFLGDMRSNRQCRDCGNNTGRGTWDHDMERCLHFDHCDPGYGTVQEPTPSSNRICAPCVEGISFNNDASGDGVCKPVRDVCGPGEGFIAAATVTRDRTCLECPSNSFKTDAGDHDCVLATTCGQLEREIVPLTPSSDRVCLPVERCIDNYNDFGVPCECSEGCRRCYQSTDNTTDYLLVRRDGAPSADATISNPICARPVSNANPLLTEAELVENCAAECRGDADCVGFQVYARDQSEELRGTCCLKKSFDEDAAQDLPGIDFYQMSGCWYCHGGYFLDGQHCQALSDLPELGDNETSLALPLGFGNQSLYQVNLTRVPGLNYSYSIVDFQSSIMTQDDFYIDPETGSLYTLTNLSALGQVIITIQVQDSQEVCYMRIDNRNRKVLSGCISWVRVDLTVTGFLSCPDSMIHYIPLSLTEDEIVWTEPLIPATATSVDVSVNTNQTNFTAGFYTIRYETTPLSNGDVLVCEFNITAINGFRQDLDYLRYETIDAGLGIDYLMEDSMYDRRMLRPEAFAGNLDRASFAYGIYSPFATPFIYRPEDGVNSTLHVRLAWCRTGSELVESELTPRPVDIVLAGVPSVGFTDLGSGVSPDDGCFLIWAISDPINSAISFRRIDIELPLEDAAENDDVENDANNTIARRAVGDPSEFDLYSPVSPSGVYMQHEASSTSELSSSLLVLEDVLPPTWIGCPVEAITVSIPSEQELVAVQWIEPQASDNIGILRTESNFKPGDNFSWVSSPYQIVYTAYDLSEQKAECLFDVIVQPELSPLPIEAGFRVAFDRTVTISEAFPYGDDEQVLLNEADPALTFDTDFNGTNALELRILPANDDIIEVRQRNDSQFAQFVFELSWSVDGEFPDVATPNQDAVSADMQFEQFQRDASDVINTEDLNDFELLYDALCHVDATTGRIVLSGVSRPFAHGFKFQGLTVRIKFPRGVADENGTLPASQTWVLDPASKVALRHRISLTVAEAYDPELAEPFILVYDETPPTFLSCPTSAVQQALVGDSTATFNWSMPIFTDNRPLGLRLSQRAYYPDGPYDGDVNTTMVVPIRDPASPALVVEYTARDEYGNREQCIFTLRAVDIEAPVALCSSNTTFVLPEGRGTYEMPYAAWRPTSLDNSNLPVAIVEPEAGLAVSVDVGVHNVSVTVQDAWNNTGNCTMRVEVLDEEAPEVLCPSDVVVVAQSVESGANATWSAPIVVDNVGGAGVSWVADTANGSTFPLGSSKVIISATDASGNSAECVFSVTVQQPAASASADQRVVNAAISGGTFLVVLVIVLAILIRRQILKSRQPADWEDIFSMIEQLKSGALMENGPRIPREVFRGHIKLLDELGRGAFGIVYKALLEEPGMPGFLVACKSLHESNGGGAMRELLEEAAVTAQFEHPNVVHLIGVVSVGKPLLVLLDFYERGDLRSHLMANADGLSAVQRAHFAYQCAAGLEHVHGFGFIHRDIAARNVLLSSDLTCKLSDFGLAREQPSSDDSHEAYYRMRSGNLPVRWSAPEALDDQKFSQASDIWSLGILMYEIYTNGEMPYKGWSNQRVWVEVASGFRLARPELCHAAVYEVMQDCWKSLAADRPSVDAVVAQIGRILEETMGFAGHLRTSPLPDTMTNADTTKRGIFESLKRLTQTKKRRSSSSNEGKSPNSKRRSTVATLLEDLHEVFHDEGAEDQFEPVYLEDRALYDVGANREMYEDEDADDLPSATMEESALRGGRRIYDSEANMNRDLAASAQRVADPSSVGRRVYVQGYGEGVLRFYGQHEDPARGTRCGVELDEPVGRNNGTVKTGLAALSNEIVEKLAVALFCVWYALLQTGRGEKAKVKHENFKERQYCCRPSRPRR
ncbi:uncharacterized protein MONBRDRAFT_38456 [Monosiga brevicollis MX1]|uniref:non-specific protein-tyrosine kinase n=1 Tax=Monosiga brevicollis TaxID=81824 RepID=A9V7X1_MONBE|nr:uncharacterized protein MONBRDRAFT_38456 [Monosiga brevicollis MX1]EDQ86451.1 predicted protein [Monosiga brevicollis MX1]|eukprot:XP_001748841.1 hypothetical protein [Monosiga brevicollis MX1]